MTNKNKLKNKNTKGGEKMKTLRLLISLTVLLMGVSSLALAATSQQITIKATVPAPGVSLPTTKTIIKCPGTMPASGDPWSYPGCVKDLTEINFGTLTNVLTDGSNAGCFYAPDYFIVYLYPDVWGGIGYEVKQSFAWAGTGLPSNSLVFTAVYSNDDHYDGKPAQGPKPTGATLGNNGNSQAATGGAKTVYKSEKPGKPRIFRAQYGLPPYPAAGDPDPFAGWAPVPVTQAQGTYTGTLTLTISSY